MDDDQPAWLNPKNTSASSASSIVNTAKNVEQAANVASGVKDALTFTNISDVKGSESADNTLGLEEREITMINRLNIAIRFINVVTAILMSAAAVTTLFMQTGIDLGTGFIAAYVFFFAIVIFFFECAFPGCSKVISQNFGFMYSTPGRALFLAFVAGMCFRLSTLGYVSMGLLCFGFLFYVVVRIRHPKYEAYIRQRHFTNYGKKGNESK